MKKLSLIVVLFIATSAFAQTPAQVKGFFGQGQTSYQIALGPTKAGQSIVIDVYAALAPWEPGPVCDLANQAFKGSFCNYNLYDSQRNQFIQVNRDEANMVYVPASKGGPETITVSYINGSPEDLSIVVTVWPDTLVLQDVVPPRCDFRPLAGQAQICNPFNPWLSVMPNDATAMLTSYPLTVSVANELFIGHGQAGGARPTFTPGAGWAVPMWGGEVFLSYATAGVAGTQETFTLFASPPLAENQYVYLGIQGFKVIPIKENQ